MKLLGNWELVETKEFEDGSVQHRYELEGNIKLILNDWRQTPHGGYWLYFYKGPQVITEFELGTEEEVNIIANGIRIY